MNRARTALTETLRQRVVAGLHLGILESGERLPSLRRVAAEMAADPRAVMAAYRQLAAEGLVRLRPRSGVFVAPPPSPVEELLPEIGSWLVEIFLRGLSRGIPPTELRRQVRACLDTVRVRVVCLECNDDQIHALHSQISGDYGFAAVGVEVDAVAGRGPMPPTVVNADLIVTTRFHAGEAQRLGRRLRLPVIVATLDRVFINEVRRLLAQGPVWWICTDRRFAEKLPRMFPGASIKPILLGPNTLELIPSEAIVYATRRAAERLPSSWRPGRVVTMPRVFSGQTARALITFLVRRNREVARRAAGSAPPSGGVRVRKPLLHDGSRPVPSGRPSPRRRERRRSR
jgi:GntR family transcriptional regulator